VQPVSNASSDKREMPGGFLGITREARPLTADLRPSTAAGAISLFAHWRFRRIRAVTKAAVTIDWATANRVE
jgi:hypothetical protein